MDWNFGGGALGRRMFSFVDRSFCLCNVGAYSAFPCGFVRVCIFFCVFCILFVHITFGLLSIGLLETTFQLAREINVYMLVPRILLYVGHTGFDVVVVIYSE